MSARVVVVVVVMLAGLTGLMVMNYKDMSVEIPAFEELITVEANSFQPRYPRVRRGVGSIEFHDARGQRFQTPRVDEQDLGRIEEAISGGVAVRIRYGRWMSGIPSTKIFTAGSSQKPCNNPPAMLFHRIMEHTHAVR
jgi:hypothetical protein